ncbi:Transcription initiation factor TFIID subunit 13 [Smittium mucronatum]|uniref:Transcription initiation factor TFIID subunit 13 n=1 Tax=Smittium mucronatum TaxID=133383 RepID=A0A1R0GN54_9FUNG|nr:Transcription initiation factor TFIID subunit 13 [Smittium mucronatum]
MGDKVPEIQKKPFQRRGLFIKELPYLMYGFGDSIDTNLDSAFILEDMLIEYINDICVQAALVAGKRPKVTVDDFKFCLRKDPKKLARVEELISANKEIENARKMFKDDDGLEEDKKKK